LYFNELLVPFTAATGVRVPLKKGDRFILCSGTPLGPVGNAAAGGSTGATGPFAKKPKSIVKSI